jgi:hypothetical protein
MGARKSNMARLFDVLYVMSTHKRRKQGVYNENILALISIIAHSKESTVKFSLYIEGSDAN